VPARPESNKETPPSRPSAVGISVVLAVCTGLLLVLLAVLSVTWSRNVAELDAIIRARTLADLVARIDSGTDTGVARIQELVDRAKEVLPGTREILVLEGVTFIAHTDPTLAGTRLKRTVEHKVLYDDIDELADHLERNAEERKKYPELEENPYATVAIESSADEVYVAAPILEGERDVRGIVAIKGPPPPLEQGRFVFWLSLGAAAIIVLTWLTVQFGGSSARAASGVFFLLATGLVLKYHVDITNRAVRDTVSGTAEQCLALWQGTVAAESSTSAFRAPASGDEFLQAIDLTRNGDPARWFEPAGKTGVPLVASEAEPPAAQQLRPGEDLRVDSRWIWRGFGVIAFMVALYIVLMMTGKTERAAAVFREHWYAYAYVAPAVIGAVVLVFGPFLFAIGLAFYTRVYDTYRFVGLQNFIEILSNFRITESRNFYRTLGVTVMWTVVNVSLHVSIGLGLAMLLKDKSLKFTPVYRTLLIIPWALPNYITALIWKGMFNKEYGAVNALLEKLHVFEWLHIEPISWFTTFWGAFTANLVTNVWLGFPFMMVISLGALQSIPADLYEAADVDGAGRLDKFFRITLPLLKPALFPAVILGVIWTFNNFNIIYLVSAGAPDNKTDILITEAYRWAFEKYQYGYASAYSMIIFLILFGYTYVTNRITKSTEGAYE